jgi:hypothetical protein
MKFPQLTLPVLILILFLNFRVDIFKLEVNNEQSRVEEFWGA